MASKGKVTAKSKTTTKTAPPSDTIVVPMQALEQGGGKHTENAASEDSSKQPGAIVPSPPEFPNMYAYLPRFWAIGVESSLVTREPVSVNMYKEELKDAWILIMSYPGICVEGGQSFVQRVMYHSDRFFYERNCRIFLLSTDRWTELRKLRNRLEGMTMMAKCDGQGSCFPSKKYLDVDGVTFIADDNAFVAQKLGMLCEGKGDEKICYPGYLLLTPDKELVQCCILRNSEDLCDKSENTLFRYPLTDEVMETLIQNLDVLMPIYAMVEKMKKTYPRASFGTFFEHMITLVDKEETQESKEKESIFKWTGWGSVFGKVLSGNLKLNP